MFGRDLAWHTATTAPRPNIVFPKYIVAVTSFLRTRYAARNGFHRGEKSSDVPYICPAIGSIADAQSTPSCLESADARFRGASRQALLYVSGTDGRALGDVVVVERVEAQRKVQLAWHVGVDAPLPRLGGHLTLLLQPSQQSCTFDPNGKRSGRFRINNAPLTSKCWMQLWQRRILQSPGQHGTGRRRLKACFTTPDAFEHCQSRSQADIEAVQHQACSRTGCRPGQKHCLFMAIVGTRHSAAARSRRATIRPLSRILDRVQCRHVECRSNRASGTLNNTLPSHRIVQRL